MTGWRAGYAVAPPELKARLIKVVEHTLTCIPPFIQRACLWGLQNAEPDVVRFREEFRARRDRLFGLLSAIPGLDLHRPSGAFYMFPRYDLQLTSVEFCNQVLDREKLAVVPGISFGPAGEGHFRISFTAPIPALEDGARRLDHFMRESKRA
jgi:aspartate/methionine/tyrosine aminotransferase